MPLTEYIEHLYLKRFGRPRPQERSLLCLLFEYAAILGLVDVAFIPPAGARRDYHRLWGMDDLPFFSRYDGLMFCRIRVWNVTG
jgi:hypothetical protein